ncbi:MAG: hypothetical protein H7246_12820, partial [Phycisphaerae bacterium]|nr:hypothetical protein [Saprospiraceae bacterium]
MSNKLNIIVPTLAASLLCLCFQNCGPKDDTIIVNDDILMLTAPASGLESVACDNFASNRSFDIPASNTRSVNWSEAKSLPSDTIKIIRLEILSDTGSVAKFTMTLRPLSNKPSEIQCMKGFGCTPPWVNFPWIVPGQNILDQTVFKFKVKPAGLGSFTIENYNTDKALT